MTKIFIKNVALKLNLFRGQIILIIVSKFYSNDHKVSIKNFETLEFFVIN